MSVKVSKRGREKSPIKSWELSMGQQQPSPHLRKLLQDLVHLLLLDELGIPQPLHGMHLALGASTGGIIRDEGMCPVEARVLRRVHRLQEGVEAGGKGVLGLGTHSPGRGGEGKGVKACGH